MTLSSTGIHMEFFSIHETIEELKSNMEVERS